MLVHRNIGANELVALVQNKVIKGTYDIVNNPDVTIDSIITNAPVVSFFASDYWWVDDEHTFEIWLDIPDHKLMTGKRVYYADKDFEKTHVWNGRVGPIKYEVPEAYATEYSVTDIRLIVPAKKPLRNIIGDLMYDLNLQGTR